MGFSVQFFNYIQLITLVEEIFVFEVYKFSIVNDKPLIIDCGGNIGLSVLYFKSISPASRIMVFEPDKETFELLQNNIRNNHLDHVVSHNVALTNTVGNVNLFRTSVSGSLGMSLIQMPDAYPEMVLANRLSDFVREHADLLKIDVEGSEIQILEDLIETGKIQFIRQMVIEFHPSKINKRMQDYLDKLSNCDFDFYEHNVAFPQSSDRLFYFRNRRNMIFESEKRRGDD